MKWQIFCLVSTKVDLCTVVAFVLPLLFSFTCLYAAIFFRESVYAVRVEKMGYLCFRKKLKDLYYLGIKLFPLCRNHAFSLKTWYSNFDFSQYCMFACTASMSASNGCPTCRHPLSRLYGYSVLEAPDLIDLLIPEGIDKYLCWLLFPNVFFGDLTMCMFIMKRK